MVPVEETLAAAATAAMGVGASVLEMTEVSNEFHTPNIKITHPHYMTHTLKI